MNNTGNAEYQVKNCHGCKLLDRYKEDGRGYCSRVERSEQGKAHRRWLWEHREEFMLGRKEEPSVKVRTPDMERCELYEEGLSARQVYLKNLKKEK